jgi:membrane protein
MAVAARRDARTLEPERGVRSLALRAWRLLADTVDRWLDADASSHGAALAFYTLFSLAPLLLIAVAVASSLFGEASAREEIVRQIQRFLGPESARLAGEVMVQAASTRGRTSAGVVGAVALFVGATTVFNQLQEALNEIWGVRPKHGRWLRNFLRKRALSFGLVLAVGFLLIVSLVLSAIVAAFGDLLSRWLAFDEMVLSVLNFALFFGVATGLFASIYRILPDARIAWRDVWVGAFVTALAIAGGKLGIERYLGESGVAPLFGVAGSLVVLLLWVYYASMIVLLGAAFTRVWSSPRRPEGVRPEPGARRTRPS